MKPIVYDAGVLVASDRSDRRVWAEHRVRLELGELPIVPSQAVAQVSRSPRQVQLRRFLRGCEIVPFHEADAHRVGALLGESKTTDVVDATVVDLAVLRNAELQTGDRVDIERLVSATRRPVRVVDV